MGGFRDLFLARIASARSSYKWVHGPRRAAALALYFACCVGCAPPRTPADHQEQSPQPPVLAHDARPVRATSFPESPALQNLADAGAWITLRTTFLPAANRGTLIAFEEQSVSDDMLADIRNVRGDVFVDFKDCRFEDGALRALDGLESIHALTIIDKTTGDAVLQDVSSLPNLEVFIATSPFVTNKSLGLVENAKHIHYLSLDHAKLGDLAVPSPDEHQNLIELHLWGTSITDDTLRNIAELPVLMRLDLTNCDVGDVGVAHLGSLKELRYLDLDGTKVTDAGLEGLRTLTNLENLDLTRTAVTGTGLAPMAKLPRLETLDLSGTSVNDDGLQEVLKLRSLRAVVLRNSAVTDAGVLKLAAMPRLDHLDVLGTNVTDAVRAAFAPTVTLLIGEEPESAKDPSAR